MSLLSEDVHFVKGCPLCQRIFLLSKDVPFVREYLCQRMSLLSEDVPVVKRCPLCQRISLLSEDVPVVRSMFHSHNHHTIHNEL